MNGRRALQAWGLTSPGSFRINTILFPASDINRKVKIKNRWRSVKYERCHFPFALFVDFHPFPSEFVEPIIIELFFFPLHHRSREFSVRSYQRRRRLLKKPQRFDRRSGSSNRVQTWMRRPPSLRSSKPNTLRFLNLFMSISVAFCLKLIEGFEEIRRFFAI